MVQEDGEDRPLLRAVGALDGLPLGVQGADVVPEEGGGQGGRARAEHAGHPVPIHARCKRDRKPVELVRDFFKAIPGCLFCTEIIRNEQTMLPTFVQLGLKVKDETKSAET